MDQQQAFLLHLSLINHIGPVSIHKIITFCEEQAISFADLYRWSVKDFYMVGFSEKIARCLVEGLKNLTILHDEQRLIEQHNICLLSIVDERYPSLLKNIYMPPPILYLRGRSLVNYRKNIAVVGARNGNYYAQSVIKKLLPPLVENGWTIVSGGAYGVDAMAHRCALECLGSTIAVLGSGLLRPYPEQHKNLFKKISENGTLVSPFPLMNRPQRGNFPARNRIIAGLSQGVVVIQAGERSGALITARYGLDHGKEIFAVPGNIDELLSAGCHNLIRDGAHLVSKSDDILAPFGEVASCVSHRVIEHPDPVKKDILSYCKRAISLDDLVDQMKISADVAYAHLFSLQVEGLVEQNFLGQFQIVSSRGF